MSSISMLPVLLLRRLAVADMIRHEQMGGYVEKKPFGFVEELRYLKNFREADLCPDSRRAPEDVAWAEVIVRG